ncbi:MAG: phosphodiester glycosidase family protein [Phycisphaerae bacterium]
MRYPSRLRGHLVAAAAFAVALSAGLAQAAQTANQPFAGVTHIFREDQSPRPVRMHVLLIDLKAPGIRFMLTPRSGPRHTVKQTTLEFLTAQKAQIAINAHYFEPWPPPSPDDGAAELVGLAASNGDVYSPFNANPPKAYAIRANAPALNIDADNRAAIVHRSAADSTGRTVAEPVRLFTALAGNEQILTDGKVTAGEGKWDNTPNPLTVIGLARAGKLVILIVDGRQKGTSEGLSTREAAGFLARDYGVTDAINLDGGGSTTLCMADPTPRVVNVPVGLDNKPGTLRPVGSNLAIFAAATPATQPATTTGPASGGGFGVGRLAERNSDGRWALPLTIAAVVVLAILVYLSVSRRKGGKGEDQSP